jgi:hypothetical protein
MVITEMILFFREKLLYIHRERLEPHSPWLKRRLAPECSLTSQCMLQQQPTALAADTDISSTVMLILPEVVVPVFLDGSQQHHILATMLNHSLERRAIARTPKPPEPSSRT